MSMRAPSLRPARTATSRGTRTPRLLPHLLIRDCTGIALLSGIAADIYGVSAGYTRPDGYRGRLVCSAGASVDSGGPAPHGAGAVAAVPDDAMTDADLAATIDAAWEAREQVSPQTKGAWREAVETALDGLDEGKLRVAEPGGRGWQVHQWLKKAVLLSFRLNDMVEIPGGPIDPDRGPAKWWDKVPSKFAGWSSNRFRDSGFRAVPGAIVRRSAYIAPNVVPMPSFGHVGAHVGSGTMVDTWATVGSCAQIGKNCHLSGGVGIGGVLEPLQVEPVIIEDDCFIGARREVVEGVLVEQRAVLAMGPFMRSTT